MKREAERPLRAILAGQLIDGTGASPITDAVVVIEGERIAAVGRRHDVPLAPEAEVIDASDWHGDAWSHRCPRSCPHPGRSHYQLCARGRTRTAGHARSAGAGLRSARSGYGLYDTAQPRLSRLHRRGPPRRYCRGNGQRSSPPRGRPRAKRDRWSHGQRALVAGGDNLGPHGGLRRSRQLPPGSASAVQTRRRPDQAECLQ